METMPITPQRKAQIEAYAKQHDQTPAEAEWEQADHEETVQALLEAEADIATGRTRPAEEVYASLRLKHGLQD